MDPDFYIDRAFVLQPLYMSLNKVVGWGNIPCVKVKPDSNKFLKVVAPIANVAKKAVFYLAFVITAIATVIFSILSFPYRCWGREKAFAESNKIDLNRLSPLEKAAIQAEISKYVEQHGPDLSPKQKQEYVFKTMVSYARSNKIYGPIVRAWTEYLLVKANKENKKLVFMARDGIAPYKMARKLMATAEYQKKFPNLNVDRDIILGYFSRKGIKSSTTSEDNQKLFQEYVEKELGIQKGDRCFFVDVGYAGSMIDDIKGLLPDVEIDFEYCISMTEKAKGFIAREDSRLNAVSSAWANPGIHWIEDAHQGNEKSSSGFVKVGDHVYPNTKQPDKKQYCSDPKSLEYLIRKFSQRAVVRCFQNPPLKKPQLKVAIAQFDDLLEKINTCTIPWFFYHRW